MRFCTQCLYGESHPLGITFDQSGLCSGCQIHQEKDRLDWKARWEELKKLVSFYKSINRKNYDCIVPVTGAQDSYFTVFLVKEKLKMNPLLVCFNKYSNTPIGIKNLANLRIRFNCDLVLQNINPNKFKKIAKETFRSFGSMYWPILAGHTAFPVQTAVRFQIPLIIWGAHQGLEQVGMYSHLNNVEMTRRYRKDHDLMGYEADDLITHFNNLKEDDIWQFRYPEDKDIAKIGVRGIYLGNFVRWDPKAQHEIMIKNYGYQTCEFNRTFDCYDHTDCFNYMNLHDYMKLCKHGYSKVTDHASREIRFGRLTRERGLALVKKFEICEPQNINLFLQWFGMNETSLYFLQKIHKLNKFWTENITKQSNFMGWSAMQQNEKQLPTKADIKFIKTTKVTKSEKKDYITVGKGFKQSKIPPLSNWLNL